MKTMWKDLIQSMGRNFSGCPKTHRPAFCAAPPGPAGLAVRAHAAPVVKTEHVEAQLVPSAAGAQPGKPATVGLRLQMAPHWHTYWKNPGDSGLPTRIKWTLPEGWKAGEIRWPHPQHLPVGPLMNYGYEDEVVLLVRSHAARGRRARQRPDQAKADWLVCKEVCIPEKGELDLALPVAAAEPASERPLESAASSARADAAGRCRRAGSRAGVAGKTCVLRVTPPAGAALPAKAAFFPERDN